jgi:hypothetical protein
MFLKSKRGSLLIMGITALICSRALFALFNDPEGPNLLVVVVMAAILYLASLAVFVFGVPISGLKRLLIAVFIQVLLAAALYFVLT